MNLGKFVVLLFAIGAVVLLMQDLLTGIVTNEAEIRTTANLIGDLVAMIPFTSEEILGLILLAGMFILFSKYQ